MDATYSRHLNLTDCEGKRIGACPDKVYFLMVSIKIFDTIKTCDNCIQATIYEFSMIAPGPLACYVGFTEQEVKKLCEQYGMDMEEVKNWYDGYFTAFGRSGKNSMRSALRESLGKRKDTLARSWA